VAVKTLIVYNTSFLIYIDPTSLTIFINLLLHQKERDTKSERGREMEVMRVLHMNKGNGETSYAKNSTAQVDHFDINMHYILVYTYIRVNYCYNLNIIWF